MTRRQQQQPQPKRRIWPVILLAVCFLTAAVAGAMFASSGLLGSQDGTKQGDRENKNSDELIKAKDKATILIMGVDIRKDDVGRSDTMMLATVDPKLDKVSLLSVPRDTRVRITGHGFDKINAAFAFGGEALSEKTVEDFLGINIDHYVIINVRSFVKIIDAIGGVDIDVEKRMYYEDPWDDDGGLYIDLYPGEQHMDGKTAVTYVRYRDSEGDIGRIRRQQKFMDACMKKVTSPEIIPRIPAIIREVADAVDTDMTFRQLLELAGALKAARENGLETAMVPGRPLYIDGISYWVPDVEELRFAVASGLGVSVDSTLRKRNEKVAGEYMDSIPDDARDIPEGADNIGDYSERPRETLREYYDRRMGRNGRTDSGQTSRNDDRESSRDTGRTSGRRDSGSSTTDSGRSNDRQNYGSESRRSNENYSPQIERRQESGVYDEPFADTPTRDGSGRSR